MVNVQVEDDGSMLVRRHKEKYLGYDVYLEYMISEGANRYRVSYRVIEEFNPAFSEDPGCVSMTDFKRLRSYRDKKECISAIEDHFRNVTVCELRRDFIIGDDIE